MDNINFEKIKLEPFETTIKREYKDLTIIMKCSGFTDGHGEIYYNSKDVKKIEDIMDIIKESF